MATGTTSVSNNQGRPKRKPGKKFLLDENNNEENFLSCIFSLINYTLKMTTANKRLGVYMDEMLHSIFFLGYIHKPRMNPKKFFKIPETIEAAMEIFPGPFEKYNSHLPTRTPFSILLDMMKIIHGTEEKIIEELPCLLEALKFPHPLHKPGNKNEEFYTLESTVICVCYSDRDIQSYYGASLSCRKQKAKEILIDLSCLETWHEYVSHAVMSFNTKGPRDGITFPESVTCRAYIRDRNVYRERRPCLNCQELFNLENAEQYKADHPYGNCAETECLSKLLSNNQYIQKNTRIENHTEENVQRLTGLTKARLVEHLSEVGIQINEENFRFYRPMQRRS